MTSLHKRINTEIHGRLALADDSEADLLYKYADRPGIHLEIGTLWGGTAILAGLAKKKYTDSHVYTIDFMQGGYWDHGDPGCKLECPTQNAIIENISAFGLSDVITSIKAPSAPLPISKGIKPVTVLIDGGHSYDACLADWKNVKKLKPDFVLFHDYNTGKHPGVQQVVDQVVKKDKGWKEIEAARTMIVFARI